VALAAVKASPRVATPADVVDIVRIVNAAFVVEAFFATGDRTHGAEIQRMMREGDFLLLDDDAGVPVASAYVGRQGEAGYIGMVSVDPRAQGGGLGRTMMEAAEQRCRAAGCRLAEIHIVSLRTELPPFYRRLGYAETGATVPFPAGEVTTIPCHFIVMTKRLDA
jgi:GNAT superfamily N-acetyltransferase